MTDKIFELRRALRAIETLRAQRLDVRQALWVRVTDLREMGFSFSEIAEILRKNKWRCMVFYWRGLQALYHLARQRRLTASDYGPRGPV